MEVREGRIVAGGAGKEVRVFEGKKEIGRVIGANPWYSVDWEKEAKVAAFGGSGGEVYEVALGF